MLFWLKRDCLSKPRSDSCCSKPTCYDFSLICTTSGQCHKAHDHLGLKEDWKVRSSYPILIKRGLKGTILRFYFDWKRAERYDPQVLFWLKEGRKVWSSGSILTERGLKGTILRSCFDWKRAERYDPQVLFRLKEGWKVQFSRESKVLKCCTVHYVMQWDMHGKLPGTVLSPTVPTHN